MYAVNRQCQHIPVNWSMVLLINENETKLDSSIMNVNICYLACPYWPITYEMVWMSYLMSIDIIQRPMSSGYQTVSNPGDWFEASDLAVQIYLTFVWWMVCQVVFIYSYIFLYSAWTLTSISDIVYGMSMCILSVFRCLYESTILEPVAW